MKLYQRINQLTDALKDCINYLINQSMLTPDEEALLDRLERILSDGGKEKDKKCSSEKLK